jgi:hypothetical protein
MSLFNQMIRGGGGDYPQEAKSTGPYKSRTFKETIQDQISFHENKVAELKAVRDSLTPEIETFVEALQKLG